MLYRAEIVYHYTGNTSLDSDLAIKIHGAAMRCMSSATVEKLHLPQYHALSMYCLSDNAGNITLHISALDAESGNVIAKLITLPSIQIYGSNVPLVQVQAKVKPASSLDVLTKALHNREVKLIFATPTVYKTAGKYTAPPSPEKYFYSVIRKMNQFSGIAYTYEEFLQAWAQCRVKEYELYTKAHLVTGYTYTGMTGNMTLVLPKEAAAAQRMKEVLCYAVYSGLGSKTAQGMGGFQILS